MKVQNTVHLPPRSPLVIVTPARSPSFSLWVPHICLLLAPLVYAGMGLLSKPAFDFLPSTVFSALRATIALPFLFVVSSLEEHRHVFDFKWHVWFLIAGLTGIVGDQSLFLIGLELTGPSIASLTQPLVPLTVCLVSMITGFEKPKLTKLLALGSALAGTLVVLRVENFDFHHATTSGIFILLLRCLSYATYLLMLQHACKVCPAPLTLYYYATCYALPFMWVLSLTQAPDTIWSAPWTVWFALIYAGVLASAAANGVVSWSVRYVNATVPSLYLCLNPIVSSILASIIFHEPFGWHEGVGLVLILHGLLLIAYSKYSEHKQSDKDLESPHVVYKGTYSDAGSRPGVKAGVKKRVLAPQSGAATLTPAGMDGLVDCKVRVVKNEGGHEHRRSYDKNDYDVE